MPTDAPGSFSTSNAAGGSSDQPSRLDGDSACVLWHHPDLTPPRELIASLTKHGANVLPCRDGYSALAMACKAMRGSRGEPRAVLLLLVEPAGLPNPGAGAFIRAARRYAPRSACWWFATNANPAFRVVTAEDLAAWEGSSQPVSAQTAPPGDPPTLTLRTTVGREAAGTRRGNVGIVSGGAGPTLRLAVDASGVARPVQNLEGKSVQPTPATAKAAAPEAGSFVASGIPESPRQALTADELAMLLGEPELPTMPSKGGMNPETRKKP